MVAFGAVFAIKIAQFFNDVVKEGLGPQTGLEATITDETESGASFRTE